MVEKCDIPHLFLTLIADEMTSLQSKEVTDIKTISKWLKNTFTWKDCPVKCATFFYNHAIKFMNEITLSKAGALGCIKDYLI